MIIGIFHDGWHVDSWWPLCKRLRKISFPNFSTGKAGCDLCSQTTMAATQQRKNIYGDRWESLHIKIVFFKSLYPLKKDILFIFTTMGSKIYLTYLIWIPPTNLCPLPPTSAQTICLQTKTHRESLRESLPEKNMSKEDYMATFGSFVHWRCRYTEGKEVFLVWEYESMSIRN